MVSKRVYKRVDRCVAVTECCVLGFEKKDMKVLKQALVQRGLPEEFKKLEVVIRGNYLVKKEWRTGV